MNFFQEIIVDDFLNSVSERFSVDYEYKIQWCAEIIIYQPGYTINLENTRLWLTNVYTVRDFYPNSHLCKKKI